MNDQDLTYAAEGNILDEFDQISVPNPSCGILRRDNSTLSSFFGGFLQATIAIDEEFSKMEIARLEDVGNEQLKDPTFHEYVSIASNSSSEDDKSVTRSPRPIFEVVYVPKSDRQLVTQVSIKTVKKIKRAKPRKVQQCRKLKIKK